MGQIFFTLLLVCLAAAGVFGNVARDASRKLEDSSTRVETELDKIKYLLWTRSNTGDNEYYELKLNNATNLDNSNFNPSGKTYLLNQGWGDIGTTGWILGGKTNLLALEDCNVISCDWRDVVNHANYNADVERMYEVAGLNAQLLDWLVAETGITTNSIELAGHSLGGQAVGMTAFYMTSGKVGRITGLDPAGPEFYQKNSTERIDKSQGEYVDIIHTNGCWTGCSGMGASIGHADFFPNGGVDQVGCDNGGCSHGRAPWYWVESIGAVVNPSNNLFTSWPCTSWDAYLNSTCQDCGQGCLNMGFNVDRSLEGNYYLSTNEASPYAKGNVQN